MSAAAWIGVALLGGLGSAARFVVSEGVAARAGDSIRWGTLMVNLSGALALGLLVGAGLRGDTLELVGVGFLGGYTTFSAWMLEAARLGEEGRRADAVANVVGSLVAGVLVAWLGRELGMAL